MKEKKKKKSVYFITERKKNWWTTYSLELETGKEKGEWSFLKVSSENVKIFPVELWLSWAAAYSITQSVFPLLSVFLLILTFFLISTPWLIAVFHAHLSRLKLHISRPSTFNCLSHFPQSLCLSQQSIIELSVVFICFLFPFFQLSLWLSSPTPLPPPTATLPTTTATSSCAPTPLHERVWSGPTIDRYIVPDRLDCATSQQTRGRGGGGRGILGNVCFSVSNLVRPEELHTPLSQTHHSWRPDVHDYTQIPAH